MRWAWDVNGARFDEERDGLAALWRVHTMAMDNATHLEREHIAYVWEQLAQMMRTAPEDRRVRRRTFNWMSGRQYTKLAIWRG